MLSNQDLINHLISSGYLKTERIIKAFLKVDRKDFVPEELLDQAYKNYPLAIGDGQTISQPATVAFMLELLQPQRGDKILDVGSGSGWQTALLAEITGSQGKIFGLEIVEELIGWSRQNIQKYHFNNIKIIKGNGWQGLPAESPFDKIIVAAAAEIIPQVLKEQLEVGGRLVVPVGVGYQDIVLIVRESQSQYREERFPGFVFVPLINE